MTMSIVEKSFSKKMYLFVFEKSWFSISIINPFYSFELFSCTIGEKILEEIFVLTICNIEFIIWENKR